MFDIRDGDCIDVLARLADEGARVDAVVTDPPYHLTSIVKRFGAGNAAPAKSGVTGAYKRHSTGFMGKQWDGGDIAFDPATWAAVYAVMKPGAHLVAFGGTRTHHRIWCAIEDAGFEIRDTLAWLYGSGFPKSHNVSKAIDKAAGADGKRAHDYDAATPEAAAWQGWGTALKPAFEPIILARKPLSGTVAQTVLEHGTGALNIDGSRVETTDDLNGGAYSGDLRQRVEYSATDTIPGATPLSRLNRGVGDHIAPSGRWPANVVHDGSDEVMDAFAAYGERAAGGVVKGHEPSRTGDNGIYGHWDRVANKPHGDTGTAARFFYCAKAGKKDRAGSAHPTVKPVKLIRWLVRMVTPPGGLVLDPFAGSGTLVAAAAQEGFDAVLIEREPEYVDDIRRRVATLGGGDTPLHGRQSDSTK